MMTQTFHAADGKTYDVHDDVELERPGAAEGGPVEASVLARWRANEELDPDERRVLAAWTTRANLHSAAKWLDGKPLSEFGFETLDQVHGQAWHPDVCDGIHKGEGCVVHQVFDHRLRHGGEEITVHAHRSHKTCARHSTVEFKDHHHHQDHLQKETRHKEAVLSAITDKHGLKVDDRPAWHFNDKHELVIVTTGHPHLSRRHVLDVLQEFPDHAVHVV
jgi:hypothetical protein